MTNEIDPAALVGCFNSFKKVAIWTALIIAAFIAWAYLRGDDGPSPDTATVLCQDAVKDRLRAPATAKFPRLSEARVSQTGERFRVRSQVDAENAFGALVRSDWDCVIRHVEGREWEVVSLDLTAR